ncbi:BNR-4 repeat-containing protein [Pelagicoccus sp. NFK12]|uniref:BNR-4 repeat-containing protein n=1 Tax=Pelagicoccus enzymogenes TaxID=2773457 RepID=A0A927II31_9BACT|nr:BNR-4 repeat-containing protein [Pelagicoccus enzymogenes]MBD5780075.1 BNR-4 repeat-containing protein [Pelagicoccus enzymogenes]
MITIKLAAFATAFIAMACTLSAEVTLEAEIHLNDQSLYFDGKKVGRDAPNREGAYDYFFGNALVPHGDCIKTFKQYVFLTWYRGGKEDRHVMLTRLDTDTGKQVTIEFPHRHTGYVNKWWIGETHNTIAVGISPKNGTIHLLYDMHAYRPGFTDDGAFDQDYFRYSYSIPDAATVPDEDFNLDLFMKSPDGDYKHLTMDGVENAEVWGRLTYPTFFLNDEGDLFMYMRKGSAYNGRYFICKYDGESKWNEPIYFNVDNANQHGLDFTYGVYGRMKYADGKIRVAFQRRNNDRQDRYIYQNGVYYASSDNPNGKDDWKNHKGEPFELPLADPSFIKVYEPGDYVATTQKDMVHMVGYFDFNVTDRGDEHIISRVRDNENDVTKFHHAYRASGESDFTVTTDFAGGVELYAAGNYILMITLKDGRPFVQRTEGGTNHWQTVYEPTSGRIFDKGIPHISNGKLYYYLKEPGSGDTRTTYLQIIDLDLN